MKAEKYNPLMGRVRVTVCDDVQGEVQHYRKGRLGLVSHARVSRLKSVGREHRGGPLAGRGNGTLTAS